VTVGAVARLVSGAEGEAHEVAGGTMLVVAIAGLVANLVALVVLRGGAKDSINLRGAYLEVLGDAIGSMLVIAAALVIVATGWTAADPIASLVIAALILPRALLLLRDVMRVLSQSTPAETDVAEIRDHILETRGVVAVHDVHVWAITTGAHVFSAHVEVESAVFAEDGVGELLDELGGCLSEHFDVEHSTFQLEPSGRGEHEHEHTTHP
jgi:cobalt-zinc-cadmium efflux system protein